MPSEQIDTSMEHISSIENQIRSLESKTIAKEVLSWLIHNVENYIDNNTVYYKIDLIFDNDNFPEVRKTQDLYRQCGNLSDTIMGNPSLFARGKNELEKLKKCRTILDEIIFEAFFAMKKDKEQLSNLFKKMVFFYEKIIPNPEAKKRANEIDTELKALVEEKNHVKTMEEKEKIQTKIIEKIDEGVSLVRFTELEGAVDINKFEYEPFSVDVSLSKKNEKNKEIIKEYKVDEGFTVWLEISHRPKLKRPVNIF